MLLVCFSSQIFPIGLLGPRSASLRTGLIKLILSIGVLA